METILYKDINSIRMKSTKTYDYKCLSALHEYIDTDKLYYLLDTHDVLKLKNIYAYIAIRMIRLNRLYPAFNQPITFHRNIESHEDLDHKLHEYIQGDIVKSIVITNSILCFFFP